MDKINFDKLEPNRNGIHIEGNIISVQGYNKKRGIQTFYDAKENLTSRIVGININDEHFLINEDDFNYNEGILNHPEVCKIKRAYLLTYYDQNDYVAIGKEICNNQFPSLLDRISLILAGEIDY